MKLKQYLHQLNKLVEDNPIALDMEVYYVKDDEGNSGDMVHCSPSVIQVDEDLCPQHEDDWNEDNQVVVCIN